MKNNCPLISVVMSVYNDRDYLAIAIESILNQTFTDFEFLIIDDGSSDGSKEIIKNYASKDKRIKFIKNPENLGLATSLNKLIKLSRGEYIARMDADDESFPERFEKQINYFNKFPETDVLGTGAIIIDNKNKILERKKMPNSYDKFYKNLFYNTCFIHPSVMARKRFYLPNNLYKEEFLRSEDWYIWADNFGKFKYSNLDEYLLKYRSNNSSSPNGLYWSMKVKIIQGLKRKDLRFLIGISLTFYSFLKKKILHA